MEREWRRRSGRGRGFSPFLIWGGNGGAREAEQPTRLLYVPSTSVHARDFATYTTVHGIRIAQSRAIRAYTGPIRICQKHEIMKLPLNPNRYRAISAVDVF